MILKKQALAFFICCALTCLATGPSFAQATTACDPDYMDALEARAWLEAQREITQNQNLISKPDSVLEYTCFNSFLDAMADNYGDRPFSETSHWGTPSGLSSSSTDAALNNTVRITMTSYLRRNFQHDFMGDRLQGLDYNNENRSVSGRAYNCDMMARVWETARCLNFMQRPGSGNDTQSSGDGFYDFPWYAQHDPRNLPRSLNACQAPTNPIITQALPAAFNNKQNVYSLQTDNDPFTDGTPYKADRIITNLEKIEPGGCSSSSGHYVLTGIKVKRDGAEYDEIICTNPACAQSGQTTSCATGGGG